MQAEASREDHGRRWRFREVQLLNASRNCLNQDMSLEHRHDAPTPAAINSFHSNTARSGNFISLPEQEGSLW